MNISKHEETCSGCPVFQNAKNRARNGWRFDECRDSCWRLSPIECVTRSKGRDRRYRELASRVSLKEFKRLYYRERWMLKDIRNKYSTTEHLMFKYMIEHRLEKRCRVERIKA